MKKKKRLNKDRRGERWGGKTRLQARQLNRLSRIMHKNERMQKEVARNLRATRYGGKRKGGVGTSTYSSQAK